MTAIIFLKKITGREAEKYREMSGKVAPVCEKTVKMADGVLLPVRIFRTFSGRLSVFGTADAALVSSSVLYELFLTLGGGVLAYSTSPDGYTVKAFFPMA